MPAPQYVRRSYGGGADVAQLTESMGSSDQSFAINPTTGWLEDDGNPLGTVGPFTVVIDRFTASVEKILCSSVDLVTGVVEVYIDMADGWSGRGYDGTAPQAHVPGGSPSGVQTCWSAAEANEANQAVYDVLGGGSEGLIGVPIGSSLPFNGTPLTLPTNFLLEDGSAVSRTTYSACFTAIIIATTGTTTAAGATISAVSSSVTPFILAGMKVTLTASAGAIYTVQSVTSTTVVLTSGVGITAATGGAFIVYPHGAGDGSTTFNLPDSRGRSKYGQGSPSNTAPQPQVWVGETFGNQYVTISQSQLPTTVGTSASVADSGHEHLTYIAEVGTGNQGVSTDNTSVGNVYAIPQTGNAGAGPLLVTNSATVHWQTATTGITVGTVSNSGGGAITQTISPGIGCSWIIRVT